MDEDSGGERDCHGVNGDDDDLVVLEWVEGLPSGEDLVPLSQQLVSPELASAFSIPPADLKTTADIRRAAQHSRSLKADQKIDPMEMESSAPEDDVVAPIAASAEGDSSSLNPAEENCGRMLKRARLVWTPQLHKRFVDVVARLGIKNAVPKTIMQLMNVDGLTRENVASHLQKYRLYLKRMQAGMSNEEGPASSSTDHHLFASTAPPQKILYEQQQIAMPYAVPTMIPMQVYSIPHHHAHGVVPVNINHPAGPHFYKGFDHPLFQPYAAAPNDCSGGSKFASIVSNPTRVSPGTREKHNK